MQVPDITWPKDAAEAIAIQQSLRQQVRIGADDVPWGLIAGIDVSYDITNNLTRAVVVVLDAVTLTPVVPPVATQIDTQFPYVPGLLSFREIPAILKALSYVEVRPDILMVDGHGIAHPRRLGIAAHLGVLMDMPSMGVAKKRLTGKYEEPALEKGSMSPLIHREEQVGMVLRSKDRIKPLFVSPGHRLSLVQSVAVVKACLTKYKLPEPTRLADAISKKPDAYMRG
ncbi:deoxyribonuclease V [Asticcacaulis tiandongensis]|uniref:deoxyribonuclease V n=1 Tax=Asticcacaulis tiandongensis TaxID=2565365 RepID=UPI001126E0B0|nr:deoxyribonuclease V [Asticcacaulis tiandongensis]